jgi:hypothetical protein
VGLAPVAPPTLQEGKGLTFPVMPIYLQHPDRPYWFEFLSEIDALYFQSNRAMSDEQHPLAKFEQELMMAMTDYSRAALIVGLRFNTGGDGNLARERMTTLQNVCVSQSIRY